MKKCAFYLGLIILWYSGVIFAGNYRFYNLDIPRTVVLEETGDVLTLRGAALHKIFFEDSYVGAFYSHNSLRSAKAALADAGPKRMWLYFLDTTDNLSSYWEEVIKQNNPPDIIEREQLSISQFLKMVDVPLQKGDYLVLDYVPNVGTKVTIRGLVRGVIKGNEFYNLLLKVWMGRQPPSDKFQKDLFNLS